MLWISLSLCILYYLLIPTFQLTCSIYDYTKQTLACVSSCHADSILADQNKCLRKNQYIVDSKVMICQSQYTSLDKKTCCLKHQFLNDNQCLFCNGNVYQNGKFCCSNSQYMNYAATSPQCTKISTGQCPLLTFQSIFKVCCPKNQFYHITLQTCVSQASYNCDSSMQVCCDKGKYLEYFYKENRYRCIQNCNWNLIDSFKCGLKFCSSNSVNLPSALSIRRIYTISVSQQNSPTNNTTSEINSSITNASSLLIATNGQCCYGISTTKQCIKNLTNDCGKRFINRGWTICCAFGLYYSVKQQICVDTCVGYALFNMLCITNGSYLNLLGNQPVQMASPSCNGITLPSKVPVCCPKKFYLNALQGCKFCSGTIHRTSVLQVCCLEDEYYDKNEDKCKICDGKVDMTGLLCCFQNQYFAYSSSGVGSCNGACQTDNIYQSEYCCQSLTISSCQSVGFRPNSCNPEYFVDNSCQVCPRFCTNTPGCTQTNDIQNCAKQCPRNYIYFSDVDDCLSCDDSCDGCTAPLDNSVCTSCAQGFVRLNNLCVKCSIECKTCTGTVTNCSSCYQNSPKPYLQNGQCVRMCGSGSYDDQTQGKCIGCNFNCVQCQGSSSTQCSKCSSGAYVFSVVGDCSACSSNCKQCFKNDQSCISCKNSYKYYLDTKACTQSCLSSQISIKMSNSSMQICFSCHKSCKTCEKTPQNCKDCINNSYYLDSSIGVNVCLACISPCVRCISKDNCTSCIDGYYINTTVFSCIQCVSTCKTCFNGLDTGCLSCFGDSQLVGGKCVGCSSSCAKCDISQNCLQCNTNFFQYSGSCLTSCPDGFYGQSKKCLTCYSKCKTCSDGTESGCLSCQQNLQIQSGKCVGCSANCQTCNSNLSCTQCMDGYFLYQEGCFTQCPKGTFVNAKLCKTCVTNCNQCTNASFCNVCVSGFPILYKGQCLVECPSGLVKVQNSSNCQQSNNNTNNNNTNNNTNNTNNTNNNTGNNGSDTIILYETFYFEINTGFGYLNLYFSPLLSSTQIDAIITSFKFSLINLRSGLTKQIPFTVTQISYQNKRFKLKIGPFSMFDIRAYDAILTTATKPVTVSTHLSSQDLSSQNLSSQNRVLVDATSSSQYKKVSAQFYNQLIVSEYSQNPLQNIKVIGIFVSILFFVFASLSKFKSHFLAQESNALMLHFINFAQVVYLFKYLKLDQNGYYGFLQGFGYSTFSFFPNFFSTIIPSDYVQITNKPSLIPDANLIRNSGYLFSYQLIIIAILSIFSIISFALSKVSKFSEMPQIRKIMRLGIFMFHVGFLPELFFSFLQLFIPSKIQIEYSGFHTTNIVFSYLIVFIIPLLMAAIIYHFYATYNSDVLEHYFTLREAGQYVQIYAQSIILALSIDRPLVSLCLIPLQVCWVGYNYLLYRYGEGYTVSDCTKFIVCGGVISFAYLFLSLIQQITYQVIISLACVSFVTLSVYGIYQIVGLYYFLLFRDKYNKQI